MAIYRGEGGAGDANNTVSANAIEADRLAAQAAQAAAEAAQAAAELAETNAGNSETAASNSSIAAAAAQAAAEAVYDDFDDRYLGAKAVAPTLDNDGDALQQGTLYFNTATTNMWAWDGAAWVTIDPELVSDTTPQLGGDLDLNSSDITGTGNINITGTITQSSNAVLDAADIGVSVQGYDVDTAKYDDATANFTGVLQNGGSNVVVDTDIGSTVQAYDVDTAKIDVNQTWTAAQRGATQTANATGSTTLDFDTYQNFVLTLTGNVTLANPSTESVGQSGFIVFIQDGTGGRTVSLGTDYESIGGLGLTISSVASTTDIVPYIVAASGRILLGTPQLAFS